MTDWGLPAYQLRLLYVCLADIKLNSLSHTATLADIKVNPLIHTAALADIKVNPLSHTVTLADIKGNPPQTYSLYD
jgi:hypothetical protein